MEASDGKRLDPGRFISGVTANCPLGSPSSRDRSAYRRIVEANGGATVWSWKGIRDLTNTIVLLEEGAQFQILAAALGGSKPFGPGVLEQQWKMGKLVPADARVEDDGTIRYAEATAAE